MGEKLTFLRQKHMDNGLDTARSSALFLALTERPGTGTLQQEALPETLTCRHTEVWSFVLTSRFPSCFPSKQKKRGGKGSEKVKANIFFSLGIKIFHLTLSFCTHC